MTRFATMGTLALAVIAWAGTAQAQRAPGSIAVDVTAGTEGVGPEVAVRVDPLLGIRANATFLGFGHSFTSGGIAYHGHADLASGGAMLDLHPFRNGFFLSAGGRINGNHGEVTAVPGGNTRIGNTSFTPAQIGTITGRADTRDFAPQLSLGYSGALQRGFVLGVEAGALFQGAVRIRDFSSNGTLANDPIYAAQLEAQRQRLQSDADGYKVYPVLQVRLGYRF